MGKGWSRGLTAATDPRIARAAAAHRGMKYERRIPIEKDKRLLGRGGVHLRRTLALEWSAPMAYVVGLMATDGCLFSRRRYLNFKSQDEQLVLTFLACLGRPPIVRRVRGRTGNLHYMTQFGDAELHRWLSSIGLMPRKSLVLGSIDVPDELFFELARGLLDGDGSVINYWYRGTGKASGRPYESITTRFLSGSRTHLEWVQSALWRRLGIRGCITRPSSLKRCWALSYAIRESCLLLPRLYPKASVPKLERKWLVWDKYAQRHGHPATLDESIGVDGTCDLAHLRSSRPSRDQRGRFLPLSRVGPALLESEPAAAKMDATAAALSQLAEEHV